MQKLIAGSVLVLLLAFGGGTSAFAQTPVTSATATTTTNVTTNTTALIAQLQAQIAVLTAQLATMHQTIAAFQINAPLHQGMSGEDVRTLQEVLATDSNLFSQGNVTGFYGPLTAKAVAHMQTHFGLDSVGFVGPLTLEKINELLKMHDATSTESLSEGDLGDLGEDGDIQNGSGDHNNSGSDSESHNHKGS
jgi:murein L,D-transpeptidase YcbB/YkuD